MPHDTLWVLAHNKMTPELKRRCVDAFQKLHAHGILHGQPDLRHLLIGADGRVSIIDFSASRAVEPNKKLNLFHAKPADFEKELRIIKYKLDYEDAEVKEAILHARQDTQSKLEKAIYHARSVGIIPEPHIIRNEAPDRADMDELLSDDFFHVPDTKNNFERRWKRSSRTRSRDEMQIMVPGKTNLQIQRALTLLQSYGTPDIPNNRKRKSQEAISPNKRQRTEQLPPHTSSRGSVPHTPPHLIAGPSSLKRKSEATHSEAVTASKRPRLNSSPIVSSQLPPPRRTVPRPVPRPDLPPLPRSRSPIEYTISSSFSVDVAPDLPVASSSQSTSSAVKVRDFASEPYSGQRGYYVPHPPTEGRIAVNRALHIRWNNCLEALWFASRLPDTFRFYHTDADRLKYGLSGSRASEGSWALGTLKRAWAEEEILRSGSPVSKHYSLSTGALVDLTEDRPVSNAANHQADKFEFVVSNDIIQLMPKRNKRRRVLGPKTFPRGILRSTPLVKPISYQREDWPEVVLDPGNDGPELQEVPLSVGPVLNGTTLQGFLSSSCRHRNLLDIEVAREDEEERMKILAKKRLEEGRKAEREKEELENSFLFRVCKWASFPFS
ncbi:hypothetical protein EUX98_g41 [Antrodiella citrinella]|uniref:Protein kinase domain-containing protein n=1 Tax=Antrodiella citrinella TaxID=2447956 RepID=A0A4S4N521_9APHY|nr:hypothetical protein EUX98_g41 [Antrodiella citrinella]